MPLNQLLEFPNIISLKCLLTNFRRIKSFKKQNPENVKFSMAVMKEPAVNYSE